MSIAFERESVPEAVRAIDVILRRRVRNALTDAECNWWLDHCVRVKRAIILVPVGALDAVAREVLEELAWAA